jgi:hypothetical protein
VTERIVDRSPTTALRVTLASAAPALRAASARLWQRPGLAERYPRYLRVMHGVIRASVPLMDLAARRCAALGPADPVAGPLRAYLRQHIVEEAGHDDWLLADLAALGADPRQASAGHPPAVVARLVGAQYYWVEHFHPVAVLGYIAVLESNAPSVRLADWLMSAAGVPADAVRTVREHAELDTGHSDAVHDLIDELPLTPAQISAVTVSGLHTAEALMALFAHIGNTTRRRGPVRPGPHPPSPTPSGGTPT